MNRLRRISKMTEKALDENNEEILRKGISNNFYLIPDDLKGLERFEGVTSSVHLSDDEARNYFNSVREELNLKNKIDNKELK